MDDQPNGDSTVGSRNSAPSPPPFTEENVINAISQLYSNPAAINEANSYLTEFQQHMSSWGICISIMNRYAAIIAKEIEVREGNKDKSTVDDHTQPFSLWKGSPATEQLLFFASQTLCTQGQAGFPQQLASTNASSTVIFEEIRNGLCNLVYNYRFGPRQVLKQLCMALCACLIFSHEDEEFRNAPAVNHLMATFGQNIGEEGYDLLMEILTVLAEELFSKRLAIHWELRESFIRSCLKWATSVWNVTAKVYQQAEVQQYHRLEWMGNSGSCDPSVLPPSPLMKSAMRCFSSWVTAYVLYAKLLEEMDPSQMSHDPSVFVDIFNSMKNQELFVLCLKNLFSTDIEMVQICTDAVMYALGLTQSKSEETLSVLRSILQTYGSLFDRLSERNKMMGGLANVDSFRLIALSQPLVEMTKLHFPNMLYHDFATSENALTNISTHITELLKHSDIAVKEQALDFWYNLLSHQLSGTAVKIPQGEESLMEAERFETEKKQREILKPFFQRFVKALVEAVAFPESTMAADSFDFLAFQNFRDECSINLTESTIIVGYDFLLELAGAELLNIANEAYTRSSDASKWNRVEACLFVLTTVAPRAPAGGDTYIPAALGLLPQLSYPTEGITAYLLRRAASRLIFWTAGYIGTKHELFARIFQLVACQFAPFVLDNKAASEAIENERLNCEGTIVQTLNSLTASAGLMIVTEGESEDIHIVLNALTALIVTDGISSENKASLIVAAGSILSYLPKEKMQELHKQLVEPLGENLFNAINSKADKKCLVEFLKLYFTALQCVRPVTSLPPAANGTEVLPVDSELRHPVLNVLGQQWSLVEDVIMHGGKSEVIIEQGFNSIVSIFSTCRAHVTQDTLFYSFLDLVGKSFVENPTVFHLAAVRTVVGMFAYVPMETVLVALSGLLKIFVEFIINNLEKIGEEYVFNQPDLIGMTIDCVNVALMNCMLAQRILEENWFLSMLQAVIQLTPNCLHPKVLHTFMVCLSRLVAWVSPPPQLYSFLPGYNITWLHASVNETKALAGNLLVAQYGANRVTYIHGIINAVIKAVTNVHSATQSWIGNAAQVLLPLLNHSTMGPKTREILRVVILEIHPDLMAVERKEAFYFNCTTEKQPRTFADMLLRTAEETQAEYRRSQFKNQS